MKSYFLFIIVWAVFLSSGPQDATHHLLHGLESHESRHGSATAEIRTEEIHPTCWIEEGLRHRSAQIPVITDSTGPSERIVSITLFSIEQSIFQKSHVHFCWLARGPPGFSFSRTV